MDIVEMLNFFFIEIGLGFSRDVLEVDKFFEEFFIEIDKNFVFEKIILIYVFVLLLKFCKLKVIGLDNILVKFLRECFDVLVEFFIYLFN